MSKLVLGYWSIRGLAERIRLLLEYLGLEYEQVFYLESKEDQWFKVDKPTLLTKNPALNLPYLIDGEKVITESTAILIYLTHKAGRADLLGRNADEQVLLATAYGVYKDFHPKLINMVYETNPKNTWEEALAAFSQQADGYLKKLGGLLGEKEFLAGGLTYIDFILADLLQALNKMNPQLFAQYPNLLKLQERVWSLPELKSYFGSDRWHEHPINGE